MTPLVILASPLWGWTPRQIARVTDWQVRHLYAGPFFEFVAKLTGRRPDDDPAEPPEDPPEHWDRLVAAFAKKLGCGEEAAETEAARYWAVLEDLKRAEREDRERAKAAKT